MNDNLASTTLQSEYFRNPRAAGFFALAAFAGIVIFIVRHGLVGIAAIVLASYCMQAAMTFLVGVSLTGAEIRFPRTVAKVLPILVFWRIRQAVAELDEITSIGPSFGLEWVILRFSDAHYAVPFASRDRRLKFFDAVRATNPAVRIYRAY